MSAYTCRKLVTILLTLIWICNTALVNFLQLVLRLTVRPWNKPLFRQINYYLIYSSWSQLVAVAQHWAGFELTMHFKDKESQQMLGKEHCLTLMNHKYEVDWLYSWLVMNHFGSLASSKSFAKKSLMWVPIIGWSFYLAELVFLERSWDKDQKVIGQKMDNLMAYEHAVNLLLFAEGTRFTPQKYQSGVEFSKERGLHVFKHHLVPRTRGFTFTVKHSKDKLASVYNTQLDFPTGEGVNKPDIFALINAQPLHGHMYFERIPLSEIPTDDDKAMGEFLFDVYKRKDELTDYFLEHKTYPGEIQVTLKKSVTPLFNLFFSIASIFIMTFGFIYFLIINQLYGIMIGIGVVGLLLSLATVFILVRSALSGKGSSYGVKNINKGEGLSNKTENAKPKED